jgi:hypothetical protein
MRSSFIRLAAGVPRVAAMVLLATACAVPQVRAQDVAPAPLRSLEDAIESHTDKVVLPVSQPGTLTFRSCAEPCRLRSLLLTSESKLFVGGTQATLAEFNAYIRETGPQFLMVFRKPNGTDITRLVVYGQLQR